LKLPLGLVQQLL